MDSKFSGTVFMTVLGVILLVLTLLVGISAALGALTMFVWNAIVPAAGGPAISFYVAWGLWFLVGAIFSKARSVVSSSKDK